MTNTTATVDRTNISRAPKGGAVSIVNGQFYSGGQFMPLVPLHVQAGPATLEGSTRQVDWARRIRREALARLEDQLYVHRLFLADRKMVDPAGVRRAMRRDSIARHALMVERSAAVIIRAWRAMIA